jgi:DNA replication protein DnaC
MTNNLMQRANQLRIYSIAAYWDEIKKIPKLMEHIEQILSWEEEEKKRRQLDLLVRKNGLKKFDFMAEFDWKWPKKINREQIEDFFSLKFIIEKSNIVLIGPNGVGKTMIAQNLVHTASQQGYSALFVESSRMLNDLIIQTTNSGLEKALQRYVKPKVLAIDEVGYLAYDSRHADLLFQLMQRRSKNSSTIVTTNRSYSEWPSVFPNAACVTALIDRLIEQCEVSKIEGDSYRAKRFQEKEMARQSARKRNTHYPKQFSNNEGTNNMTNT